MPCSPQVQKKQTAFRRFASVDSGDSGESGQSDSSGEEGSEDEDERPPPGEVERPVGRARPACL
jgi:hypothetical protein